MVFSHFTNRKIVGKRPIEPVGFDNGLVRYFRCSLSNACTNSVIAGVFLDQRTTLYGKSALFAGLRIFIDTTPHLQRVRVLVRYLPPTALLLELSHRSGRQAPSTS